MKEQKQIFKELLILIILSSIATLLATSLVNIKLDEIDKNIKELKEDINQIQFEKSFEKTCQLEVIDCDFE